MEKKIMLIDAVKKFNSFKNMESKTKYVSGLLVRKYAPVGMKYAALQGMLERSIVTEPNGVKYINMFVSKVNFNIAIILLYTNIELPKQEDGSVDTYGAYDLLIESGLFKNLVDQIGENEINELLSVNKALLDSFNIMNDSVKSYVADIIQNASMVIGTFLNNNLDEILSAMNDKDKVQEFQDKVISFVEKYTDVNKGDESENG